MPQVQKPEVRERICRAALAAFARGGFAATTMSDIARDAGMAVANLYRYYASKEDLFDAVVPEAQVARFERLLERSVRAHAHIVGLPRPKEARAAGELLDFWIEQRLLVIILLDRSRGSKHDAFAQRFVRRLTALTVAEIESAHPGVPVPAEARLVLHNVFENTRRMISAILESCEDEAAIRRAIAGFRSYQVAGLAGFTRWLAGENAGPVPFAGP